MKWMQTFELILCIAVVCLTALDMSVVTLEIV